MVFSLGKAYAYSSTNSLSNFENNTLKKIPNSISCAVTSDGCSITLTGLQPTSYSAIYSSSWQLVWVCNQWNGGCNPTETISNLDEGTYNVYTCGQLFTVNILGCVVEPCATLGGDSDDDGVCDNQDCHPYDPFFPNTPGVNCDDGNPYTINDVVSADGCSCAGQLIIQSSSTADPHASQRPTYRTIDGSLNNFVNPKYGMAGAPYFNEIPPAYGDGVGSMAGQSRPSSRHISNQLSDEPEDRRDQRLLSGLLYQFGQFVDHDIAGAEGGNEFAPISVPHYDPVFTPFSVIPFNRSKPLHGSIPREQINNLTHYIDASNVYGSDHDVAAWLRTFSDGKLKTSEGNLLPFNTVDGEFDSPIDLNGPRMDFDVSHGGQRLKVFVAGDLRANEHPNLTALHTVFVREHNRLCDYLISQGYTDDEAIYLEARKLVGAMMQQIVYEEYLPSLGVNLSSYNGYNHTVRPDIRNTFAVAAYRWHTMVENDIIMRNDNCEGIGTVELPLKSIFGNPSIIRAYGAGVLLRGSSFHPQYRTDLKVNNGLRNFLFGQGQGLDLVAINIQRGRDHGLPDYKTVRQFYGGGSVSSFSDINSDSHINSRLQSLYGNVNDIDLWVGIFSEPLVSQTSLPSTAIAIVKRQFEALRDGDAYYYEYDPAISSSDMSIINSSSLKNILERNTSGRSFPSNIFFKPPCNSSEQFEDTRDHGDPVCNSSGASYMSSCSFSSGTSLNEGFHLTSSNVEKVKVELGFGVRIYNTEGKSLYYTDDPGCLPDGYKNNVFGIEVICLSKDQSTIDCTGFAGALFSSCFSSPLPIFTPGNYNTQQLKSLSVDDDDIEAIRVNNGFKIGLYEKDNFQGEPLVFVGPTVVCLPASFKNKMSSMVVTCMSDPNFSNCGFNGIAGAVFENSDGESNDHRGVSVGVGDYNASRLDDIGIGNNKIKKLHINNGYAITLFQNDNFQGDFAILLGDESHLDSVYNLTHLQYPSIMSLFGLVGAPTPPSNFESSTSSMKVRCIEGLTNPQNLVLDSEITLTGEKDGDRAQLEVTYNLAKEAIYQTIEKYDGRTGEFEFLRAKAIETNQGSYSYIDTNTLPGDNIYRVKVFYADETEEETPYESVWFDSSLPFNIFPNPTSGEVNLNLEKYLGSNVDIAIYDLRGVEVFRQKMDSLSQQIVTFDLSELNTGNYVIRISPDGKRATAQQVSIINEN